MSCNWSHGVPSLLTLFILTAVIILFSASIFCGTAQALLYRAPVGSLKDNCVIWHDGTFYLFTMYRREQQIPDVLDQWHHVWLATSTDGVHWKDVGPVIEDAPFLIFAMRVWKAGDRFVMNHGSFTGNKQDVLRFWESPDLVHWTYLGPDYDVRRPDGARIDHMSVLTQEEDGKTAYYGYAVGGMLRSDDGVKWSWVMDYPLTDDMNVRVVQEPGGIERIDDTVYLLVGGFFPGSFNYAVATYIADNPMGPFSPDYPAFRLNGSSGRNLVGIWASFCRTSTELLMTNYILDPGGAFWWHPPLKTAVVDDGHLRMGYWKGNDAMKGPELGVDLSGCESTAEGVNGSMRSVKGRVVVNAPLRPHLRWLNSGEPNLGLEMIEEPFGMDKGLVLEGTMRVVPGNHVTFPAIGLCFEEEGQKGTAVLFGTCEQTDIGKLDWSGQLRFESQDRTGFGCATVAGIPAKQSCHFRILFRANIFECYLNDLLVQTWFTDHPTGRIGFVVQDGEGTFGNVRAWEMDL